VHGCCNTRAEPANKLRSKDVKAKKNSKKADGTTEDDFDTTATLIHLAESELNSLVYRVLTRNGVTAALERKESHSLVIAAMGRMMANAPKLTMEAAIQVAHAITTHEAIKDMDYFTAVDDLNTENSGAGHLDINEFTSGVFYRHFSIDVDQLKRNWLDFSSDDAPERLRAMLSAMILSLPTGKIASTAAHTIPALIIVEQTTQGLSMATAFDAPVKARGDGYIVPSIIKLEEFRGHARLVTPSLFGAEATFNSIPGSKSITFDELLDIAVSWMR
jgi:CRISPR system Cascade subunit CasC